MKHNVSLYLDALKNDIYLSKCDEEIWGVKDNWFFKDSSLPFKLTKYSALIVGLLFPFIYVCFVLLNFIKSFIYRLLYKKIILDKKSYFLAVDNFSLSIQKRVQTYATNAIWICNTRFSKSRYDNLGDTISIYSIASGIDILMSSFESICLLYKIYRVYGRYYILYALNGFDWFVYKRVLDNMPVDATIYFFNQKDRWAIMEDSLEVRSKILIQHGTEIIHKKEPCLKEFRKGLYCYDMPIKSKTLTEVYALSEDEYDAMKNAIFDSNPKKHIIGIQFNPTPLKTSKFSVLIVGLAGAFDNVESKLLEMLTTLNVDIYLKNHPTKDPHFYDNLLEKYQFNFINSNFFPLVDLVISYESTLALEYESVGVDVIYHTNNTLDEIENYIKGEIQLKK